MRRQAAWMVMGVFGLAAALTLPGCPDTEPEPIEPEVEGNEVTLTSANFESEVLSSEKPVLVDFTATWCGPCQLMKPTVKQVSVEYADRLKVGMLDVDENEDVAAKYDASMIPLFVIFHGGEPIARQVGGMGPTDFRAWVDETLADSAVEPVEAQPEEGTVSLEPSAAGTDT